MIADAWHAFCIAALLAQPVPLKWAAVIIPGESGKALPFYEWEA